MRFMLGEISAATVSAADLLFTYVNPLHELKQNVNFRTIKTCSDMVSPTVHLTQTGSRPIRRFKINTVS